MSAAELASHGYLLITVVGVWLAVQRAGMPIVGAAAFVAIGGYGTALLGPGGARWPLGLAVVASIAIAAAAGAFLAAGASRLDPGSLALASWGLVWLSIAVLRAFPSWSGGEAGLTRVAPAGLRSGWLGLDLVLQPSAHVAVAALLGIASLAIVWRLDQGPLAPTLAAIRVDPGIARTLGVQVERRRQAMLAASAALCALGGAGGLVLQGVIGPDDVSPLVSVELFAAALIAGARWWGPLIGTAVLVAIDPLASRIARLTHLDVAAATAIVTGAVLLVVVLRTKEQASTRRGRQPTAEPRVETASATGPNRLEAHGLRVEFGAIRAVDDVSIVLAAGQIHALIGPNGSGKSTVLRAISGALATSSGAVTLDDSGIDSLDETDRVLRGIARSTQRDHPLIGVSPMEQMAVAAQAAMPHRLTAIRHLVAAGSTRAHEAETAARASDAMRAVGLEGRATGGQLDAGSRRLLQVGRVVATGARFLLLDEPAAGMTAPERRQLASTLRQLAQSGHGILLVEHDLELVAATADVVTVLAEGKLLTMGTAEEVRIHPEVIAAYLGTDRIEEPDDRNRH